MASPVSLQRITSLIWESSSALLWVWALEILDFVYVSEESGFLTHHYSLYFLLGLQQHHSQQAKSLTQIWGSMIERQGRKYFPSLVGLLIA